MYYTRKRKFYWRVCKVLRETKCIETYPSKTVIEDLITRDGPPTRDSFSPFEGKQEAFRKQFAGEWAARYKFKDFMAYQTKDFEPNVKFGDGFYTLEDCFVNGIELPGVAQYIDNIATGYKKNNTSPAIANRDWQTWTRVNPDDDSEDEEKYLVQRNDEMMSNADYEELLREIPYVLKTIWSYSKRYKAHLISFALAYQDIILNKHKMVTVTDFADYVTYYMSDKGDIKRRFYHSDDNKYVIYPAATKIFINPTQHVAEFEVCQKYLKILKILGIDYRDEDPLVYTNQFMESLVCTYLPSNNEYFVNYGDVDAEVMVALKPENIFATKKSHIYQSIVKKDKKTFDYGKSIYFASERLLMAYQIGDHPKSMFDEKPEITLKIIDRLLTVSSKKPMTAPRQAIEFSSDGFMYFNKEPFTVGGEMFGTFMGRTDYKVAFTVYGLAVILEENYSDVFYMTAEDVLETLEEYEANEEIKKTRWKSL